MRATTTNETNVASQKKASLFARTNSQHFFLKQRQEEEEDDETMRSAFAQKVAEKKNAMIVIGWSRRRRRRERRAHRHLPEKNVLPNNIRRQHEKNNDKEEEKNEIIPSLLPSRPGRDIHHKLPHEIKSSKVGFDALRVAGVRGVHVTVFWGIVENEPRVYDWQAYEELFAIVDKVGREVSVEFAFHARECGGNDGDGCTASLPVWVHEIASREGKEGNPSCFTWTNLV